MPYLIGKATPGSVINNVAIPKTGGGFWPGLVDFYIPQAGTAPRALISLHGGKGTKGYQARVLGLLQSAPPATAFNVTWAILNAWRLIVAVPQGIACSTDNILLPGGAPNPSNPNGVNTINSSNPIGVTGWSGNGWQWSGDDSISYLIDLNAYIRDTWAAVHAVHLHGHSAGGMMVMRFLRDFSSIFGAHLVTSGPQPESLGTGPWPAFGSKPFWFQFGAADTVLGVVDGIAGAGDHWGDALWRQQPDHLSVANVQGSMVDGRWVPVLQRTVAGPVGFQLALDAWNTVEALPPETYDYGDADISVTAGGHVLRTWTYGGGSCVMRKIEGVGHKYPDQQYALGRLIINDMMQFIQSV